MKNIKSKFSLLTSILLALICLAQKSMAQSNIESEILYDTIFVYDTILVYDTIWTEELIYDTVWVYDTIFVDDQFPPKQYLSTVPGKELKTNDPLPLLSPQKQIQHSTQFETHKKERRHQKNRHQTGTNSFLHLNSNNSNQLTLNPFKGKFDPSALKNGQWELQAYGGPTFQQNKFTYSDNNSLINNYDSVYHSTNSYELGLKLNYRVAQLLIQTGIGIVNFNQEFEYAQTTYEVDTITKSKIAYRMETFVDTSYSLSWGDEMYDDSIFIVVHQYDSLVPYDSIYSVLDSTAIHNYKNAGLNHYLLEIPLLFSWQLGSERLKMGFKLGGVNQIHLYSSGEMYDQNYKIKDINEVTSFVRYNFALYGGIDCSYQFLKHWSIGADAYYKYPLRRFSSNDYFIEYKRSYGFNFYLSYLF